MLLSLHVTRRNEKGKETNQNSKKAKCNLHGVTIRRKTYVLFDMFKLENVCNTKERFYSCHVP